jgi:hypothetical protein
MMAGSSTARWRLSGKLKLKGDMGPAMKLGSPSGLVARSLRAPEGEDTGFRRPSGRVIVLTRSVSPV